MILEGKVAILYGAGGPIGQAIAQAFAIEGAHAVLCGRSQDRLEAVAAGIRGDGGSAETAAVDATDQSSVHDHFTTVVERTGGVDISINLVGLADVQGRPLVEMALDDYLRPIGVASRTHFVTATTAARHMTERRSGFIMALTATPSRLALPLVGGIGTACGAIEAMLRRSRPRSGPRACVCAGCAQRAPRRPSDRTSPSTATDSPPAWPMTTTCASCATAPCCGGFPRVAEVGSAAVLMASDHASAVTGASVNVTCGQLAD